MKTKEELLKIYSAYLPYELKIYHESNFKDNRIIEFWGLKNCSDYPISEYCDGTRYGRTFQEVKPILYSMDILTKEKLHTAGFDNHIDWLTHERENLIKKYGIENFLNKTPYGHIQYLISRHYNVFGLQENEYIKKESLK